METIRALLLLKLFAGPPYPIFAAILIGCSVGVPFSADLTLIAGGVLAGTGIFDLRTAILVAVASILFGDTITFFLGRRYGHRIVKSRLFRRLCSEARFEEISKFLNDNAGKFLFLVRFTPAARSVSFLSAGATQVHPSTFYKANVLATSIYVPSIMTIAYLGASHADQLVAQFQTYNRSILLVLITSVFCAVYYRRRVKNARALNRYE